MTVTGAAEFALELAVKVATIDKDVFQSQWKTADAGAAIAAGSAPKGVPELAPSIKPGTYKIPGGVRAVWGPTARHGIFVERGTSKMAPQPYLSPSLDAVQSAAVERLADDADLK